MAGFNVNVLSEYLGHLYHIDVAVDDCFNLGWASTRVRQWVVMRHKVKVLSCISPLSQFLKRFHRVCDFTWREYFRADQDAVKADYLWAANRPNSLIKSKPTEHTAVELDDNSFRSVLTAAELKVLRYYDLHAPSSAVSLNQNPEAGFAIHSSWNALQCLIKNVGVIFSMPHRRFLTPLEGLLAQGFPVLGLPRRSSMQMLCSFNADRARKRTTVLGQAGNSMNVQSAGLAGFVYALACFRCDDVAALHCLSRFRMNSAKRVKTS